MSLRGAIKSIVVLVLFTLSVDVSAQNSAEYEGTATYQKNTPSFVGPKSRISGNLRARYQTLSRDDFDRAAQALTLQFKGRVELDIFESTTVLAEIESNTALINEFNDGSNNRVNFPFIPDPEGTELNRLQITSEIIPKTRVTAGRQRIALDDWRFIGSFPFRQNDQTIDALRVETRVLGKGLVDVGYFNKVLRPLGGDNLRETFEGDSYFANYNLGTRLGRFSAFHYSLGLVSGPKGPLRQDVSTETTGVRLLGRRDGKTLSFTWEGSFAQQRDRSGNPENYKVKYGLAELAVKPKNLIFKGRVEVLGSDNGVSLQTPLASLHRFQGFSDQFLTTPPDGLRDYSAFIGYDIGKAGPFERVRAFSRYHWFEADANKRLYGEELNLSLSGLVNNMRLSIEYSDYKAQSFSSDNQSVFLTTEFSF